MTSLPPNSHTLWSLLKTASCVAVYALIGYAWFAALAGFVPAPGEPDDPILAVKVIGTLAFAGMISGLVLPRWLLATTGGMALGELTYIVVNYARLQDASSWGMVWPATLLIVPLLGMLFFLGGIVGRSLRERPERRSP